MPCKTLFYFDPETHGAGSAPTFTWDPSCTVLAVCGSSLRVRIYGRDGAQFDEFPLAHIGRCLLLEWDKDGETLAIMQDDCNIVTLWERHSKKRTQLDTQLSFPTCLRWSKTGPQLAVASTKGNLLMYNSRTTRKLSVIGKHPKAIVCGAWSNENILALGSIDKTLTISNAEGDTKEHAMLKQEPVSMKFANQKSDKQRSNKQETLSVNMAQKSIFMYNYEKPENPVELAFQQRYGSIIDYHWFGDGYLVVGFSAGFVVVLSTHLKEIGEELHCVRVHEIGISSIEISQAVNKAAISGSEGVRILDMTSWKECPGENIDISKLIGECSSVKWTNDGQILTVVTTKGCLVSYLVTLPPLSASYDTRMVYLSSLREVVVVENVLDDVVSNVRIPIEIEPSFLSIGQDFIGAGMNNLVWIYNRDGELVRQLTYQGTVTILRMNNSYCAALYSGKIQLHPILQNSQQPVRILPDNESPMQSIAISSLVLTSNFLIYSSDAGLLIHLHLDTGKIINEYRHDCPIRSIHANSMGTRVCFVDASCVAYLYNPIDSHRVPLASFPNLCRAVLWDQLNPRIICAIDTKPESAAHLYVYVDESLRGPQVHYITFTSLPNGFVANVLADGQLHGHRSSTQCPPITIRHTPNDESVIATSIQAERHLTLWNLRSAWNALNTSTSASENGHSEMLQLLAKRCVEVYDIGLAKLAYRHLQEWSRVIALEYVQHHGLEDKHYVAGYLLCMIFEEYDEAEKMFLSCKRRLSALEMRRDLLQWDAALRLAKSLDESKVAEISLEYATQLEWQGNYRHASELYEKALSLKEEREKCLSGLARCSLRLGNIELGIELVNRCNTKSLYRECASILESMQQWNDAASMYIRGETLERAARIYINQKNFTCAAPLMQSISAPHLHAQYAKVKEQQGDYGSAELAYQRAHDVDSVVRLNLEYLEPSKAFAIVRTTKSAPGALMIANYCRAHDDYKSAIEFLLIAQHHDDALQLAMDRDEMLNYLESIQSSSSLTTCVTTDQWKRIAKYYEDRKEYSLAARYYAQTGDIEHALEILFHAKEDVDKCIMQMLEIIRNISSNTTVTHDQRKAHVGMVHNYLSGAMDGQPKDYRYIFELCIAIGDYVQASRIALIIAQDEQGCGNYRAAHAILYTIAKQLQMNGIPMDDELQRSFVLLHSYIIVKRLVRGGHHRNAAQMLIRVSQKISKFNHHIVPILTSTVIECQRAGLRQSSYEYASMLMRPEYRSSIHHKYKRKIEAIVRRRVQDQDIIDDVDVDMDMTPCPYCHHDIPSSTLDCPYCKNLIPFCIVTGLHMVDTDWGQCLNCKFNGLYSQLLKCAQHDDDGDDESVLRKRRAGLLFKQFINDDNENDESIVLKSELKRYDDDYEVYISKSVLNDETIMILLNHHHHQQRYDYGRFSNYYTDIRRLCQNRNHANQLDSITFQSRLTIEIHKFMEWTQQQYDKISHYHHDSSVLYTYFDTFIVYIMQFYWNWCNSVVQSEYVNRRDMFQLHSDLNYILHTIRKMIHTISSSSSSSYGYEYTILNDPYDHMRILQFIQQMTMHHIDMRMIDDTQHMIRKSTHSFYRINITYDDHAPILSVFIQNYIQPLVHDCNTIHTHSKMQIVNSAVSNLIYAFLNDFHETNRKIRKGIGVNKLRLCYMEMEKWISKSVTTTLRHCNEIGSNNTTAMKCYRSIDEAMELFRIVLLVLELNQEQHMMQLLPDYKRWRKLLKR